MNLFKYFRPGVYLEKAIRYNEFYFSANHELNDPHDLRASFYFEDSKELWRAVLSLKPDPETWNLNYYIDVSDSEIACKLNELFKGVNFDSISGSLHQTIESKEDELLKIFSSHLKTKPPAVTNSAFQFDLSDDDKVQYCKLWLSALLARAVNYVFYSVSFSESALNPMMWAHYADGFKGCVVIYNAKSSMISLRRNLLDKKGDLFNFLKINYVNDEKRIPLLECAISGENKAVEIFSRKSGFWRYEVEQRLFSVSHSHPFLVSNGVKKISQRERIWHHENNDIVGVIFGPRCNDDYKKKIELTLLDNRLRSGCKPFYLFNTNLTPQGKIIINSAAEQSCFVGPNLTEGMHKIIEGERLSKLLNDLSIVEDDDGFPE